VLLVLNNDKVICPDCYDGGYSDLEVANDPGLDVYGETQHGNCDLCGTSALDYDYYSTEGVY
jgi:hypothetical protein